MNILSQTKLHNAKQEQARQEIERTARLAQKADSLRKMILDGEKEMFEQRENFLKEFQIQIDEAKAKLDETLILAEQAEKRRAKALEPLTEAWNELKQAQEKLAQSTQEFEKEKSQIRLKNQELDTKITMADANIDASVEMRQAAEVLLNRRKAMIAEIQESSANLSQELERFKNYQATKLQELDNREKRIEIREREHALQVESFKKQVRDFNLNAAKH